MKRTILASCILLLAACTSQDGNGLPSQVIYQNVDIQILPADTQGTQALARVQVRMNNTKTINSDTLSLSVSDNVQTQLQGEYYEAPEIPDDSPIYNFGYHLFDGLYYTHFSLYGDYYNEQQTFTITTSNEVFSGIESSITHQSAPYFTTDLGAQTFLPGDTVSIDWQTDSALDVDTLWFAGCGIIIDEVITNEPPIEITLPQYNLINDLDMETGDQLNHCKLSLHLVGRKSVDVNKRFAGGDIKLQVFSLPNTTTIQLD